MSCKSACSLKSLEIILVFTIRHPRPNPISFLSVSFIKRPNTVQQILKNSQRYHHRIFLSIAQCYKPLISQPNLSASLHSQRRSLRHNFWPPFCFNRILLHHLQGHHELAMLVDILRRRRRRRRRRRTRSCATPSFSRSHSLSSTSSFSRPR
ncbi:hypothetical protein MPH_05407 [Macrophomina phaseolina MS6]|uniref:Uncharacterized protein n=1 Tax=Macrophomina phaseolina (strain MS6) TaxID=1126212 RepID=K2R4M6_MACPH|nr:hypothetical protein MPH_05407 [Macrophomina phaseolina MS6]